MDSGETNGTDGKSSLDVFESRQSNHDLTLRRIIGRKWNQIMIWFRFQIRVVGVNKFKLQKWGFIDKYGTDRKLSASSFHRCHWIRLNPWFGSNNASILILQIPIKSWEKVVKSNQKGPTWSSIPDCRCTVRLRQDEHGDIDSKAGLGNNQIMIRRLAAIGGNFTWRLWKFPSFDLIRSLFPLDLTCFDLCPPLIAVDCYVWINNTFGWNSWKPIPGFTWLHLKPIPGFTSISFQIFAIKI